jgi:hypothetical protein
MYVSDSIYDSGGPYGLHIGLFKFCSITVYSMWNISFWISMLIFGMLSSILLIMFTVPGLVY